MKSLRKLLIISFFIWSIGSTLSIYGQSQQEDKVITLSVAGDVTLGYYYGQSNWNRFDRVAKNKGYAYFFQNVSSLFKEDDLTLVNLEGPLTTKGSRVLKEFAMKGDPSYTEILTKGNIDFVNLVNNHTMDYGNKGYTETKLALDKAQIGYLEQNSVFYQEKNGIRIACIGAKGWDNSQTTKNSLKKLITEAKAKSDLIIVMMHWGNELAYYPNEIQKNLAYYLIDEGAHLVIGSHPHVIQGIEKYKGKNIVYSLGNFCFGGNRNPKDKDSFIYQETFQLTGKGITSIDSQIIPCQISSEKNTNNYQPTPLIGEEKDRVISRLKKYSLGFKTSYFMR